MWLTSAGSSPSSRTRAIAAVSGFGWARKAEVNATPSRLYGWAASSVPKPVSTRTSEPPASISRQWQTISAPPISPPSPEISRPP